MKKKILWVSRHAPLPAQINELRRLFGGYDLYLHQDPFKSAEEIARRFREGGYDEMIVVAPLSVIQRLVELGIRPLWAEMEVVDQPSGDHEREVFASGRCYRFRRFRRIVGIEIKFEELE